MTPQPAAQILVRPPASPTIVPYHRLPETIDRFSDTDGKLTQALQPLRAAAISNIHLGLQQVQNHLDLVKQALSTTPMPDHLIGVVLQPDGNPAIKVQVQFDPASAGSKYAPVIGLTDDSGHFVLPLPKGLVYPQKGLVLAVHGANGNDTVQIDQAQVAANGLVGALTLHRALNALPVSIVASLLALIPKNGNAGQANGAASTNGAAAHTPQIKMGENGCQGALQPAYTVENFPFSVFFRLVEPRASIVNVTERIEFTPGTNKFFLFPHFAGTLALKEDAQVSLIDRVPVEQPISVDGFRDQIMGLDLNGTIISDEKVPMAGTLGLGYVMRMAQQWTFKGLGLGDLVYSLPLAPGEQQQIAIFERTDTSMVSESESLSQQESMAQSAVADTSTLATFNSAFSEASSGGSHFDTKASSESWGASFLIASGGGGSSSSSGNASEWLQGHRDTTQQAAEQTHSAASNQASARRTASRTSMRMATASESDTAITKVITNHNHTRALTLQYWEALRLYDVKTVIEGATLACMVPLQIVRFMPAGQRLNLDDPKSLATRAEVLTRYICVIKHADVLERSLPRQHRYALTILRQFAADPSAQVEPFGGAAEEVIQINLTGTFLPCENIFVTAVTKRGTRVGPVQLNGPIPQIPENTFTSKDAVIAYLRGQRHNAINLTGNLALPPSLNRNDVVGFEIRRAFHQADCTLISPEMQTLNMLNKTLPAGSWLTQAIEATVGRQNGVAPTIHLHAGEMETELGGPFLYHFQASILEFDASGNPKPPTKGETYANDSLSGVELPAQPYPVPALQMAPVLQYSQILEIEKMAQHVVRNTVNYSKAVWRSLTAEERAIMLEGYTIGMPPGGITDVSQMIPLLNCVENRVLGFYGNSMVMPFIIPQELAERLNLSSTQIQNALSEYHQAAFTSPQSTIALPTRGVLGEAVLGHFPSAEKIDITRFWNWADAPADTAPSIAPTSLPTTSPSLTAGLTGPDTLSKLPTLINNVLTAPTPDSSLLQALSKSAASQQDFSTSLTGAAQLQPLIAGSQSAAESARADALKTTKDLQSLAIATAGNIVGGIYGGNPTAGSNALAAQNGGSQALPQDKSGSNAGKGGQTNGSADNSSSKGATGKTGSGGKTGAPSGGKTGTQSGGQTGTPSGGQTGSGSGAGTQAGQGIATGGGQTGAAADAGSAGGGQ